MTTENNPAWRSESSILNTNSSSVDPPAAQKKEGTSPDSAQKPKVEPAKTTASGVDPVIKKVEVTQINAAKPEGQVIPSSGGPNTVTSTEVRQRKTKSSPAPAE